jgi:hypothetical protein
VLLQVPQRYYDQNGYAEVHARSGFCLIPPSDHPERCEVKLMGQGNPQSADAVVARESNVFVADKRSDPNRHQLDDLGVLWLELRGSDAAELFSLVLSVLGIAHSPLVGELDTALDGVFPTCFLIREPRFRAIDALSRVR